MLEEFSGNYRIFQKLQDLLENRGFEQNLEIQSLQKVTDHHHCTKFNLCKKINGIRI